MSEPSEADAEALHQQRDWLLVTLSCIGDAVITTDAEGRIAFLNPVAESLTGWTQEAVGQLLDSVFRIINEETRQPVKIPTIQALLEERTVKLASHTLLIARDGIERPISDSTAPITNDKGVVAGVVLVFRDITQRRKLERAEANAHSYADDIIETLREPFMVLDSDLRVKTANRSFYDRFQVSKEETEDCLVYDLGNGQWDIPGLRTLLDHVLSRNESVHDYEVEHSFPILGRKTMLLNARPFPPDSEHPELILLAVEDVSALRERADELAEADRRKDEFLAMLSHELRDPLAPMFNALQLIGQDGYENELQQEARGVIERQVRHLSRLTDDLLEVSRITTGIIGLHTKRVDVNGIVNGAMERLRPNIDRRQQELTVTSAGGVIWLDADASRLEQVIGNLLNNASKYNNPGGHIWLSVTSQDQHAIIRVRDDGIGMTPDLIPDIFDLFTQADKSLDRSEGGLGIGLALVKSLVELHRGTVTVHSEGIGKGSEFTVRLPVATNGQAQHDSSAKQSTSTATDSLRVLVVDDNVDAAKMCSMLLRSWGHEARMAHNGPDALHRATGFHPHVILCDIGLPEMDGYEVARHIRQNPRLEGVMLVAVTGYGQDTDKQRSKEAGFDQHMVKPVESADLNELLAGIHPPKTQTRPVKFGY